MLDKQRLRAAQVVSSSGLGYAAHFSGDSVHINSAVDGKVLCGSTFYGKSGQMTWANGKNFWGTFGVTYPFTQGGVTVDFDPITQEYTLNGTSTDFLYLYVVPNNTPMFTTSSNSNIAITLEKISGSCSGGLSAAIGSYAFANQITAVLQAGETAITTTSSVSGGVLFEKMFFMVGDAGRSFTDFKVRVQVEFGSTASTWEAWQPTPSPTYISNMTHAGMSKNIWHTEKVNYPITSAGVTMDYDPVTQEYIFNGTSTSNITFYITPPDNFIFSSKELSVSMKIVRISGTNSNSLSVYISNPLVSHYFPVVLSSSDNMKIGKVTSIGDMPYTRMYYYCSSGITFDNLRVRVQLEYGSVSTEWKPFYSMGSTISRVPNMLTNSHFTNGTANWYVSSGTYEVASGVMKCIGNGTAVYPQIRQTMGVGTLGPGHKMYVKMRVRVTNSVCTAIRIMFNSIITTNSVAQLSPVKDRWYDLSLIVNLASGTSSAGNGSFFIYHNYSSAEASNGKVMEVEYAYAVNLTTLYGAGKEPAQSECDAFFSWADYKSSSIFIPLLGGIKLASTATEYTYIDPGNNKWYCDTLKYIGNGIWEKTQRVATVTITGASTLGVYDSGVNDNFSTFYLNLTDTKLGYNTSLCTHLRNISYGWDNPTFEHYSDHGSIYNKYLILSNSTIGVLSTDNNSERLIKLRNWLDGENSAGRPFMLTYCLAVPITTQLALGELSAYLKNTTIIQETTGQKAYMDIIMRRM